MIACTSITKVNATGAKGTKSMHLEEIALYLNKIISQI